MFSFPPPFFSLSNRADDTGQDFVLSVCLTPDGQWVMSGSKDRGVQFWDPMTGNAQMMLQGHKNSGESFRSHSDPNWC
jgi:glucose repression regulatory protein TUP1